MDGRFFDMDSQISALRERESRLPSALVEEFNHRLEVSWIYHDCALEGVVLQYSEIKAAIDKKIISDVSLIPSYEEIKAFKNAIDWIKETAANRKRAVTLDTVKKLYAMLSPGEAAKGFPFRKDNPLHRLYYHEIAPPDKIMQRMKKLGEWLEEDATRRMHPVERAARAHFRLMNIYPWAMGSGRTARVLSNLMLLREGYPLAIVHSIDRQRYYEVLRVEHAGLVPLYVEAVATSIDTAIKFYDEAQATVKRRAS